MGLIKLLEKKPKVIFSSKELESMVKGWLSHMISVPSDFNKIFLSLGYSKEDTIYLSNYKKAFQPFSCRSKLTGDLFRLTLSFNYDNPVVIVDSDGIKKTYEIPTVSENGLDLNLSEIKKRNDIWSNTYQGKFYKNSRIICIDGGPIDLTLKLTKPEDKECPQYEKLSNSFSLNNEPELEKYLMRLSFPADIIKIFHKICEIIPDFVESYPEIQLQTRVKTDGINEELTSGLIQITNGEVKALTIFKKGYIASITPDGEKIYLDPLVEAHQKEKKVSISFESPEGFKIYDKASEMLMKIDNALTDVEDVKERLLLTK